ncbi:dimethylsulfonioproprionate lyase family protein [Pseudomonas brassicacearum]|uniref:dimethylsulfonioproprionate lyase family protein n=1 Tax=Pseudomonas brassicacearum TaxID=930166 RepID=UPI0009B62D05|nr:dimethylsulfonioproprionate lyase family protein [Pseudomonas brassicacearum]
MSVDLKLELSDLVTLIHSHLSSTAPAFASRLQLEHLRISVNKTALSEAQIMTPALVEASIDTTKAALAGYASNLQLMVQRISNIAPVLYWHRQSNPSELPEFNSGHYNAIIFGEHGIATLGNLILGVTVMGPGVTYPKHRHKPEELYIALSDSEWWRPLQEWVSPGVGGTIYNTSNLLHSMHAGMRHHLSLWFLFGNTSSVPGAA